VPDDEQINDLMATNDTEFALYQRLDKEREARRRAEYQASSPPAVSVASIAAAAAAQRSAKVATDGEAPEGEGKETVAPLPPRLMSVAEVPPWTKTQEAWLSKHHQLLAMSEQVDKNNLQVGDGGAYTVDAEGEEEDSNLDAASVDGASGGRGLGAPAATWNTRKRKSAPGAYDDGLTETQFMELVEKTEKVTPLPSPPSLISRLSGSRGPEVGCRSQESPESRQEILGPRIR
jgi:hypothetical protein